MNPPKYIFQTGRMYSNFVSREILGEHKRELKRELKKKLERAPYLDSLREMRAWERGLGRESLGERAWERELMWRENSGE